MGDEDEAARVLEEPLLEPLDGLDVEMVGRLVEQEELGARGARARAIAAFFTMPPDISR